MRDIIRVEFLQYNYGSKREVPAGLSAQAFAEQEVIKLISEGVSYCDIVYDEPLTGEALTINPYYSP